MMTTAIQSTAIMKSCLAGKIRNLPHFKTEALIPLFEAVVNAIHAIEDKGNLEQGQIVVRILRDTRQAILSFSEDSLPNITGFEIEDDGIGFTDDNYESFETAESIYKLNRGCKGVGRFLWLKAFKSVEIESIYQRNDNSYAKRIIDFSTNTGIRERSCEDVSSDSSSSVVRLIGFYEEYRKQPSAYKTCQKIAQRLFEQNIARYISGLAPDITVIDSDGKVIRLDSLFDEISKDIITEKFCIRHASFTISHIKLYSTRGSNHQLVFCAHGSRVKARSIGNLLGTSMQFDDGGNKYYYTAYVTSEYLDEHVDTYRQEFNIPDSKDLYVGDDIAMDEIEQKAVECARRHLASVIEAVEEKKKARIATYVENESPMLRAVIKYCPEAIKDIELNTSDERMAETLYSYKGKAEFEIKQQSMKLLKTQANSIEEISEAYLEITSKLEDFQKDQLAGYVIFRKMIIDLLSKKLELNKDNKYYNEEIVHDIVFPRKSDTDSICFEQHNLWLIDETLAFHSFAYSDRPLENFTDLSSEERPDIVIFAEVGSEMSARAVSLLEFKKPEKKQFDEDPTKQLCRYVRQIKNTKRIKMPNGRNAYIDDTTRFYCYAICSLTTPVTIYAEDHDYVKLQGEFGYYHYSKNLNAHIEIIDFDKIVIEAEHRHKAFFDKLGITI